MLKIITYFLALFIPAHTSFASTDAGAGRANNEYTCIHVVALGLNIWSSEKVVSVGELKLASPIFIKAKAEGGFVLYFEKGYSVKVEGGKLYYGDSLVNLRPDERDVYVTQDNYQLGVFIRLFDK